MPSYPESKKEFCKKPKYIIVAVAVAVVLASVIVFFIGFAVGRAKSSDGVSPQPRVVWCPNKWILHQDTCLYRSNEEKNWTSSQTFCSLHNASLARIGNEEKDLMRFVMLLRGKDPLWIGLMREPNQPWKGPHGEKATLEVLGNGGDCAYLNDEAKASSSKCDIEHHWLCRKTDPSKT
ncbi:C-type lectin domain family 2 member D-like [Elgaria multicarinata webbii]|uniref:C-type lectin domain family 2 member D-like n=1 Tax=Elgaria multicarinata webbii TaxID=159646 RepID=UPI002FCD19B7